MLINLRNALMTGKRLPYDAEVEYLRVDAIGPYIVIDGVTYCDAVGTYYAFTISSGGVVTHDLIPVRRGNTGYMYDRITYKLFGNAGTGDFVVGLDVVPVEYIESHGTEWINTEITADTNTKVRAKLNCLEYTGDVILGGYYGADNADYRIFQTGATVFYYDGPESVYSRIQANNINVVNRVAEIELGNFYITDFTTGVTATRTAYTGTANTPITLCHWGDVNVTGRNSKCRFYYVDIFNGQTAQLALKAIRVGTEGAMMDVLTRRIYRNAGTGAFGYGNDLKYPIPA